MISKTLEIKNRLGLHARAASVFVKTACAFGSNIEVMNLDKTANGKSIMSMMLLQAALGSEITVSIIGDDEEEAMKAIAQLVDNKFGEAQ